jgi:hypothetical protein
VEGADEGVGEDEDVKGSANGGRGADDEREEVGKMLISIEALRAQRFTGLFDMGEKFWSGEFYLGDWS